MDFDYNNYYYVDKIKNRIIKKKKTDIVKHKIHPINSDELSKE